MIATTPADGGSALARTTVSVDFGVPMRRATLIAQPSPGPCTGSIQVSADDFASCAGFAEPTPTMTSQGTTATLTPQPGLLVGRTYKVRVTTTATGVNGFPLAATYTSAVGFDTTMPSTFDWRNVDGRDFTTSARNEGACGAPWAFAPLDAMQAIWKIERNDSTTNRYFSAQELVSCSGQSGCNGGWPYAAMGFMMSPGVVDEACYPYSVNGVGSCNNSMACPGTGTWSPVTITGRLTLTSPSVTDIEKAVYTYGPVVAIFDLYTDFFSYTGGVYYHQTGTYVTGHVVAIVGWGTDATTGDYWICENCWGTGWGETGFFRIRRGTNECHIENSIFVITGVSL